MKSSKTLYSQYFKEYNLNNEKIEKLHNLLLEILVDVKTICDKYNINYMLAGGTCLGAVRHKGFIPWDDDIDIMMTIENYNVFKEKFIQEFSSKYQLCEPLSDEKYVNKMVKIYKKNTVYTEIATAGIDKFNMIFIDVFIIEKMPNSKLIRKLLGIIHKIAYKGASVCIEYKYPSPVIEQKAKTNEEIRKYYNYRKRLGWIFSFIGGINFWLKLCNKIERKYENKIDTKYYAIPSSGLGYERELFEKKVYEETIDAEFCGYKMKIPKAYDKYLSNLYGDYMKIPSEDKREVHSAYEIKF